MSDISSVIKKTEITLMEAKHFDIIIIGAGIAGISAGLVFQGTSYSWVILEAQSKIGGRIQSATFDGATIDLGAY